MNNIFYLKELKEKINYFFSLEDEKKIIEQMQKIIEYYDYLLNDLDFFSNKKKIIFIYFLKINENYLKNWLIDLLSNLISKVKKDNFFNYDDLFIEFIKNKKIIKDYFNKQLSLIYLNSLFVMKVINNEKNLNFIKNNDKNEKLIFENIFKITEILKIKEEYLLKNENNVFNHFLDFKKNLFIQHEDKIFELISNQKILLISKKNEILISNNFKDFLFVVFNINVKNKPLKLDDYKYFSIKKELKKIFIINN